MPYLGDSTSTAAYDQWAKQVKANGGVATNWPFNDQFMGQPAARYSNATYYLLFDAAQIPLEAMYEATNDQQYVYVLAPPGVATSAQALTNPTEVTSGIWSLLGLPGSGGGGLLGMSSGVVTAVKWVGGVVGAGLLLSAISNYRRR